MTAAGTVAEVWTFFPDPWPKKKHHKRRIVQKAMAGDIHRALATDGVWRIATDIEDYALHVHEVMDGLDGWKNLGSVTVSLPLEHVGKGNADMAADMPHADFTESERFEGRVLTNGGRVLDVTAVAPTFEEARNLAYAACEKIDFDGKTYRSDIGLRCIQGR